MIRMGYEPGAGGVREVAERERVETVLPELAGIRHEAPATASVVPHGHVTAEAGS
jgi:hypothetical protein